MEPWQLAYISAMGPELAKNFVCSEFLLKTLLAKNILTEVDLDRLEAVRRGEGELTMKLKLLDILMTRKQAYEVFGDILRELNQTAAVEILLQGPSQIYTVQDDFANLAK